MIGFAALIAAWHGSAIAQSPGKETAHPQSSYVQGERFNAGLLARQPVTPRPPPGMIAKEVPEDLPPYQPDCERPEKGEEANFCQQRRAADIAEDALRAAKVQTWANVVGALISVTALILSAYAARQAGVAARAASDTVQATREATQAQSRAWLSAKCGVTAPTIGRTHLGVDGIYLNVLVETFNRGASPATAVHLSAEIDLLGDGCKSSEARMNEYSDRIRAMPPAMQDAVFPADGITLSHIVFLPLERINASLNERQFKAIFPIIYGCISYRSPYIDGVRQTRFVYSLVAQSDATAVAMMPTRSDWLTQPLFLASPGVIVAD